MSRHPLSKFRPVIRKATMEDNGGSTVRHTTPILDDSEMLTTEEKLQWSQYIDTCMNDYSGTLEPHDQNYAPQWFNNFDRGNDFVEKEIFWTAFPKIIKTRYPDDEERWSYTDANRKLTQDEYCEWWVQKRKEDGKVVAITFTCENPEYWQNIIAQDKARTVKLYSDLLGHSVQEEEIFDRNGQYMPTNKYNTDSQNGVIHLVQRNNSLGAEIDIAARSTLVRQNQDGSPKTGAADIIKCSQFGSPGRSSDPHIGDEVNTLARAGYLVSLGEPVALYIRDLNIPAGTWETPDSADPNTFWKVLRGDSDHAVRCEFRVPPEKSYVVGDITINGNSIQYGGQIADYVHIKLTGIAKDRKDTNVKGVKFCLDS